MVWSVQLTSGRLEAKSRPKRANDLAREHYCVVSGSTIILQNLALDHNTCTRILRDAGHSDAASAICLLDFAHIPGRLSAAELVEKYLREHGTSAPR